MNNTNAMHAAQHSRFYIVISFIAALSGILFGYDTGVISGAILFIKQEFFLTPLMNGLVVSAVLIGALIGAIISGRATDYFGRKHLLIFDAVVFIIGTVASSIAPNVPFLIASRLLVGIAIGIASYIAPLYISEMAPAESRGALVSLNQLMITIGIFLSYLVDYYYAASGSWRWMLAIGIVPAFALLIGMCFLPYSPRWMMSRGHETKALIILRKIRGHHALAEQELGQIKESLKQQQGNWKMLFSKTLRPAIIVAAGLAFLQQITGINTIIYYAPTIFQMAGFHDAASAILATMGVGGVFVLFTVIALPLIDHWGRRPLLFSGLICMTISLLALSLAFHTNHAGSATRWIALASMVVFIMGFAISLGPIMWLMIAEIFPLKIRGIGASLATCVNWASNGLVTITFLTLIQFFGQSGTFFIYFTVSLLGIVFVYFIVPETKGCTLEEIEGNLYAGKPARYLGKTKQSS